MHDDKLTAPCVLLTFYWFIHVSPIWRDPQQLSAAVQGYALLAHYH